MPVWVSLALDFFAVRINGWVRTDLLAILGYSPPRKFAASEYASGPGADRSADEETYCQADDEFAHMSSSLS